MGMGQMLRNIIVTQKDTVTGQSLIETIITGPGLYTESGGQRVEFRGLLSNPAAWRATQLLTDVIGGIPWHAYEDVPDGPSVMRTPTPQLLSHPAGHDNSVTTFSSWAMDLIWHGNAIGIVWQRDGNGEPYIVIPVPAEYVFVKHVTVADNLYAFEPGEVVYIIGKEYYKPEDIIHIKGLCRPGALRGLGVLEQHFTPLMLDIEQRKQAAASTGAGIPTGLLKSSDPNMTPVEAGDLATGWQAKQAERRVAVLNASLDFVPLAWNPTDAQLLESRQFGHVEASLIFGVDAEWLNAQTSSRTYRNVEQSGIELIRRSSILGHLSRFEATLTAHLRPGSSARANLDSVHRADTLGRYQAHAIGLASQFLAPSEVRGWENLPPFTSEQIAEMKALSPMPPVVHPTPNSGGPNGNPGGDPSIPGDTTKAGNP